MITAIDKKNELSRGEGLLNIVSALKPGYSFKRPKLNQFVARYNGKFVFRLHWRLPDEGVTGYISLEASDEYIDIIPKTIYAEDFEYNWRDNKSDAQAMIKWLTPAFEAIEA